MARRGPKTDNGRLAVRFNALQHGVMSQSPVISGSESEEEWLRFFHGIRESLQPVGVLEEELCRDVALTQWRRRRIERFETQVLAVDRREARADAGRALMAQAGFENEGDEDLDQAVEKASKEFDVARLLLSSNTRKALDEEQVTLVTKVVVRAFRSGALLNDEELAAFESQVVGETGVTIELVLGALRHASERRQLSELMMGFRATAYVLAYAERRFSHLRALQTRLEVEAERLVSERLLLDEPRLNKVMRYEAHLRRQFVQLLHELEAMQSRRQGRPAPLARLDVNSDTDQESGEPRRLLDTSGYQHIEPARAIQSRASVSG